MLDGSAGEDGGGGGRKRTDPRCSNFVLLRSPAPSEPQQEHGGFALRVVAQFTLQRSREGRVSALVDGPKESIQTADEVQGTSKLIDVRGSRMHLPTDG